MARQIVDIDGLAREMESAGWTKGRIYDMVRRPDNPIPHKKNGKRLEFDLERVYRWWDGLPGLDQSCGL